MQAFQRTQRLIRRRINVADAMSFLYTKRKNCKVNTNVKPEKCKKLEHMQAVQICCKTTDTFNCKIGIVIESTRSHALVETITMQTGKRQNTKCFAARRLPAHKQGRQRTMFKLCHVKVLNATDVSSETIMDIKSCLILDLSTRQRCWQGTVHFRHVLPTPFWKTIEAMKKLQQQDMNQQDFKDNTMKTALHPDRCNGAIMHALRRGWINALQSDWLHAFCTDAFNRVRAL